MLETMFGQNSGLGQASESLSIGPIIVVIIVIIIAVIVILILLLILVTLSIKLMINNNANNSKKELRDTPCTRGPGMTQPAGADPVPTAHVAAHISDSKGHRRRRLGE